MTANALIGLAPAGLRSRTAACLLAVSFAVAVATPAAANPPWEPIAAPAQVDGPVQVLALAIDGSGSMREGRTMSPRARAAGRHAIAEAARCAYVVVVVFGNDARVVADRFACTDHDRQVLVDEIESVPMTASRTDVGVLEDLLAQVRRALSGRYADRGFRMQIQILSDGRPDPVRRGEQQTFEAILGRSTNRTELGEGLFLFRVDLDHLAAPSTVEVLDEQEAGAVLDEPSAVVAPEPAGPGTTASAASAGDAPTPTRARTGAQPTDPGVSLWSWVAGGAVALLALLLLVLARARRTGPSLPERRADGSGLLDDRTPRALRITEQDLDQTGAVKETLRHGDSVPVAVGVPVVFAADPAADVPLRPVEGVPRGPVFTITPEAEGCLLIRGVKGILCNGEPLARMGARVDAATAVKLELATRRWVVAAVWEDSSRLDGLLAAPPRHAPVQSAAPEPREAEVA